MILTEIDHVAIAVHDLEAAVAYYREAFGAEVHHREVVENLVLRSPRLKLREMAEIQGVTTSTVHYRLQIALKKLLELVVEEEGDA